MTMLDKKVSISLADLIQIRAALGQGIDCIEGYEKDGRIHPLTRDFFLDGAKRAINKVENKRLVRLLLEAQERMDKVD